MDKDWTYPFSDGVVRESEKAFFCFQVYCYQGSDRSIKSTQIHLKNEHNIKISCSSLGHYSVKYHWRERAGHYDLYKSNELMEQHENEIKEYFRKRTERLNAYHDATDAVLQELLIDLGLMENKETGKKERNKYIKSTSVANSLKNLTEANINNSRLALRFLGLPETIKDSQDINLDGNVQTESNNVNTTISYHIDKTSDEFFEKQLQYIDKMIDNSKKKEDNKNNETNH